MEKGAEVAATIKLKFSVYGDLPYAIQNGYDDYAYSLAHSLTEDVINCCGYGGKDMVIEDIEYKLV